MSHAQRIRVAVIRGGRGAGYDESLREGEAALRNLPERYEGVDVFISQDGVWHVDGFERAPAKALEHADVAFVALKTAEEGLRARKLLTTLGVPFVGSGAAAAALAGHRHETHCALESIEAAARPFKLAAQKLFRRDDLGDDAPGAIFRSGTLPVTIKPALVRAEEAEAIATTYFEIAPAIASAQSGDDAIVSEELVAGTPLSAVVVEGFRGEDLYAFPARGLADREARRKVEDAARAVHRALGLHHFSESRFIANPKRGLFFAGVNADLSLREGGVGESLESVGSSLSELLDHVISRALRGE